MKALVNYSADPGSVEIREVESPSIKPGYVKLRVKAIGVCGSDIHQWNGGVSYPVNYPVILGHEFAGEILEIGEGVVDWNVGDRVVCETAATICGSCIYCRTGRYNHCPERKGFGALNNGAMAEMIVVREGILHKIPHNISYAEASLTEPACVAYNAVIQRTSLKPGNTVVIIGPGPIGAFCLQMAKLLTPGFIILAGLEKDRKRMELLQKTIGVDELVFTDKMDLAETVHACGDGMGAHAVIDSVGLGITVKQSLEIVRPYGEIVKIGWDEKSPTSSVDPMIAKSVSMHGTFSHTWEMWEQVLLLASRGKIDLSSIVQRFPLSKWEDGFQGMRNLEILKSVIEP